MNCSVCGTMIPNGQTVCPNCGTAVQAMYQQPQQQMYQQPQQQMYQQPQQQMYQQPQQQMYQQPQQQMYQQPQQQMYQQPQQPRPAYQAQGGGIGAYFGAFSSDPMKIVRFVAAIILFLTPFLPCCTIKMSLFGETYKDSANIFGYDNALVLLCGLFLMIVAAAMIMHELSDYVPAIGNLMNKIPQREIVIMSAGAFFNLIATIKISADMNSHGMSKYSHLGFGMWIAWIMVIAYAVPFVMKKIKK